MRKKFMIALLLLISFPMLESQAGLFFRQGRGLFPNARGVVGRTQDRHSRRSARWSNRQSAYGYYGNRQCANCHTTRAKATLAEG